MTDDTGHGVERRSQHRRGRATPKSGGRPRTLSEGSEKTMTRKKDRPDFTRAETYMQEQAPAVAERTRTDIEEERVRVAALAHERMQRGKALRIAAAFLVAGIALVLLSDRYGTVVDAVAGVVSAFAIAAVIHVLRPRPLLRFGLVVIALACLAVTFATVLHIHLHGMS